MERGSPALQADSSPSEPPGKALGMWVLSFLDTVSSPEIQGVDEAEPTGRRFQAAGPWEQLKAKDTQSSGKQPLLALDLSPWYPPITALIPKGPPADWATRGGGGVGYVVYPQPASAATPQGKTASPRSCLWKEKPFLLVPAHIYRSFPEEQKNMEAPQLAWNETHLCVPGPDPPSLLSLFLTWWFLRCHLLP